MEPEWNWVKNISIVYTWVDGTDINFIDVKSKYNGGNRGASLYRDQSADELRYSLRSIEKYLPWHNGTIYILTARQSPPWLNTENPRIKMVYQQDIIPKHISPNYDAAAIEAFLDKIPGITERFLYLNDDFFLNNYIHPCFFFTQKTFYHKSYRTKKLFKRTLKEVNKIISDNDPHTMYFSSIYFTKELMKKNFNNNIKYYLLYHQPYVYYRDLLEPFREFFKEELKDIFSVRFRDPHKFITQELYFHFIEYAPNHPEFPLKFGGNGDNYKAKDYIGKPLPENRTIEKYSAEVIIGKKADKYLKFAEITDSSKINNRHFEQIRNSDHYLFYNFNDYYTKKRSLYEFTDFIIKRFPEPSAFEKKEYVELEAPIAKILTNSEQTINEIKLELKKKINDYQRKSYNDLLKEIQESNLKIVENYINKKNLLAGPVKTISDHENEEIKFLTTYKGESLNTEWQWAENISIVYIFSKENSEKNKNKTNLSTEELKYSLRSIEKFLPWFKGMIYIVSDDENSKELSWINKDKNNNIKIINYKEIVPKELKESSFNEKLVEIYLDKIPNLTERFIYLKKNHYFRNFTHPRFFFNENLFPKYNFKDSIPVKNFKSMNNLEQSFINTYNTVIDFFSNSCIYSVRHNEDAPFSLYRDLFKPLREIFEAYIKENKKEIKNSYLDILPITLLQNYNIYGTAQDFYPDYVAGYGYAKKVKITLNLERTIDYYGFDITSPEIAKQTMYIDSYTNNSKKNKKIINHILKDNSINFFSLHIQPENIKNKEKDKFIIFLNKLYQTKSSFEK